MENISSLSNYSDDIASYIQDAVKANAQAGVAMATLKASTDILDTLLDGTFQMDSEVPENSTFSLHV